MDPATQDLAIGILGLVGYLLVLGGLVCVALAVIVVDEYLNGRRVPVAVAPRARDRGRA